MKTKTFIITLSLCLTALLVIFRIRRVTKVHLTERYDHFIDGTVIEPGTYLGHAFDADMKANEVFTRGQQFSGVYPLADVTTTPGIIIESRFGKNA